MYRDDRPHIATVRDLLAVLAKCDLDMPIAVAAMGHIYSSAVDRTSHGPCRVFITNIYGKIPSVTIGEQPVRNESNFPFVRYLDFEDNLTKLGENA